jgi:hypothetical protein
LDTYQNPGEVSSAFLRVLTGAAPLATVDLAATPGITVNAAINPPSLTTTRSGAPHSVRAVYSAGLLNVWFDGVQVIAGLAVDLSAAGAVDANGDAFAGFTSRTGGYYQSSDITSWQLTTGASVAPLAITASSFNPATGQGSLTWTSAAGKSYRIVGSPDLVTFPSVIKSGIASAGAQTTATFNFIPAPRGFFRVEEMP